MGRKRKAETQKPKEVIKIEESSSEEEEVEEVEEGVSMGEDKEEDEEEEEEEEEEESSSSEDSSSSEEDSSGEDSSEEEDDEDDLENVDEATKRQKLRKLLEPFGKDQIISFLKDAASTDPDILSRITQKVDSDPIHRKIFVHGIGWDATQELFRQAFQPFGEMEECTLMKDKSTGRAKGYGFVLYKTRSAAKKALKNPQKKIGNRLASCLLAALGTPWSGNATATATTTTATTTTTANANATASTSDASSRKIFVGNVAPHISSEKLRSFFETFGELEDGPSGFDPVTNRPRGYAFFVFKSDDGLKNALKEPVKSFEGCQLSCRKFVNDTNFNSKTTTVNAVVSSNQKQGNVGSVMPVNPVNPGVYGAPNMSSGGTLVQQTPPSVGFVGNPPVASNFSQPNFNQPWFGASGVMGAMAGNYGINSISPSVIGSYGFGIQAALQGLGPVRPPAAATAPGPAPSVAVPTGTSYPPRPGY